MARRGFFAELQHQARVAAREAERAQRERARQHAAALREAERTQRAAERTAAQAARAAAAERKRLEKEARDAHVAAMQAEVDKRNTALAEVYDDLDSLLAATLGVDDFVDLEALRRTAEHPPFPRPDLEVPTPEPVPIPHPPEPLYVEPQPPQGVFGRKKKHEQAVAAAHAAYTQDHLRWQSEMASIPARWQALLDQHARADAERVRLLAAERQQYAAGCTAREAEAAEHNAALDTLITNLGYGATDAVEEYVSIVLSNSVYPEHFPVRHVFAFDPASAELSLRCVVPPPDQVPTVKAYKYTKASDEISDTALSQKAAKDRYSAIVHQVALRSLHEVFEADRRCLIRSVSLDVGTETTDPATGVDGYVSFVAVAADRDTFTGFELAAVVPAATLAHLGAAVSKNPYGLVPVSTAGVRKA